MNEFEDKYQHEAEPWAADSEKYKPLYDKIISLAIAHTKKNIIACDVACGTGWFTKIIAKKYDFVVGIDVSETAIRRAKLINSIDNINYQTINAFDYNFNERAWDTIFINELMYYYTPIENKKLIGKIAECLDKDGILIVSIKEMSEISLNDIEKVLAQDFDLIENCIFNGHHIYLLRKKEDRKYCFVTYDWELSERSTVEESISEQRIETELVTPVLGLLDANVENATATYFVEINQIYFLSKYYKRLSLAVERLTVAAKSGKVGIGLHIHPNWDVGNQAIIEPTRIKYGRQGYGYISGKETEVIKRWIDMFVELFGFPPNLFRSGKYRPLDTNIKYHLIENGIKVFSTELSNGLVVADNGAIFDYSGNLGKRVFEANTIKNKLSYDILINSGSLLTLDCANDTFNRKINQFKPQEVLTFVSHPKDIVQIADHLKNLDDLKKVIKPIQFSKLDIWKVMGNEQILFENYLDFSVVEWLKSINEIYDLSDVHSKGLNCQFLEFIRIRANINRKVLGKRKKIDEIRVLKFCFFAVSIFVSNSKGEIMRVDFMRGQFMAVSKFIARRILFVLPEFFISFIRALRVKTAVLSAREVKYRYPMLII
jgi:2-polyprenyl-3-methyl-5-hydroxy-6-metoxy-1,4-benzoquinol methylase